MFGNCDLYFLFMLLLVRIMKRFFLYFAFASVNFSISLALCFLNPFPVSISKAIIWPFLFLKMMSGSRDLSI